MTTLCTRETSVKTVKLSTPASACVPGYTIYWFGIRSTPEFKHAFQPQAPDISLKTSSVALKSTSCTATQFWITKRGRSRVGRGFGGCIPKREQIKPTDPLAPLFKTYCRCKHSCWPVPLVRSATWPMTMLPCRTGRWEPFILEILHIVKMARLDEAGM